MLGKVILARPTFQPCPSNFKCLGKRTRKLEGVLSSNSGRGKLGRVM